MTFSTQHKSFNRISMVLSRLVGRKSPESQDSDEGQEERAENVLPILPLRNTVVFPLTVIPLMVQRPASVQLVDEAVVGDRRVLLVALRNSEVEEPQQEDLHDVGTVAHIHRLARSSDGKTLHLIVQGYDRVRLGAFTQTEPYLMAEYEESPEDTESGVEIDALKRSTAELFGKLTELAAYVSDEMVANVVQTEDPRQMAYMVATGTRMDMDVRQEILVMDSVADKLRRLIEVLTREVEVLELGQKIRADAQSGIQDVQREYFLREQLKAIQRELGQEDEQTTEVRELRDKIEAIGMPEEANKEAIREVDRLSKLPTAAAEYSVIRTYLGWLTELPWQEATEDNLDIVAAREVLDEDHYDLVKIKDRIIEYLAVRKLRQERGAEFADEPDDALRPERQGALLCFVGPPGVGKTSLGRSIARALGRKFIRQSLGGVHDEAEIRGHRRTYIGAMPGRIIQAIRRAGTNNPVFMLDEVDKLGSDFRGDPSSALLEVLDPEQNREFRDHYLNVPFDLSQTMFIATANVLDTIPAPLLDRMEIIQLSGYTEQEKVKIAQGFLIPRQLRENGLRENEVTLTEDALREIVRSYTREAGVRNLERQIGMVCRKVATGIASDEVAEVTVQGDDIATFLSKPHFYYEVASRTQIPGVATGLAWTMAGGDILFIEATRMKGKGGFTMTGQLGSVMQESAQAALSYIRSQAAELNIDDDLFSEIDIHLHVPAGAIPKDGPSAGVTMATALASLLQGVPVNSELGMTGEITLRGQVLPVGGIKEKVLAAHRSGLKTICLPERNARDLEDIPQEVRDQIRFVLVERIEQVFEEAFASLEGSNSAQTQQREQQTELVSRGPTSPHPSIKRL